MPGGPSDTRRPEVLRAAYGERAGGKVTASGPGHPGFRKSSFPY
jgi:hypothetical protein